MYQARLRPHTPLGFVVDNLPRIDRHMHDKLKTTLEMKDRFIVLLFWGEKRSNVIMNGPVYFVPIAQRNFRIVLTFILNMRNLQTRISNVFSFVASIRFYFVAVRSFDVRSSSVKGIIFKMRTRDQRNKRRKMF